MILSRNNSNENIKVDTLIGAATSTEGNINAEGIIRIDGKHKGDLISKTDIIIGEPGVVCGNVCSSNVSISGKVEGNITVSDTLEIFATGHLIGDIKAKNISISKGAIFQGSCVMLGENEKVKTMTDTEQK